MTEPVKKVDRRIKVSQDSWEEIRARVSLGESYSSLAREYGVHHSLILRRAKKEGWGAPVDSSEAIRLATKAKVTEKITGIVTGGDPRKKVEQLDRIAGRGADVVIRHQEELQQAREMAVAARDKHRQADSDAQIEGERPEEKHKRVMAAKASAFEDLKAAKIHVETLRMIQDGERKAWGLDLLDSRDVSKLTEDELIKLARV